MIFNRTFLYGPLRHREGDETPGAGAGTGDETPGEPEGKGDKDNRAAKAAQEQLGKMSSALGEYKSRLQEVLKPHEKLAEAYAAMQIANEKFVKSGGDFFQKMSKDGEYSTAMQTIIQQSQDFFGNAKRGTEAMLELGKGMKSFSGLSAGMQVELANVSMKMGEVGFKVADVAKALDNQAMAFGSNEKDLKNYALSMSRLSSTLFVEPTELMNNFNIAQENFAYSAEGTFEVFTKMQEQSAKTGVAFQKMAGTFGDGMDKFGDVTGVAGKLNAILGSSVFNPLELLNMDEADRISKIREGIQGSPILNGRDINELSKFELKSIASTLNMSVLETRKFLTRDGDARQAMQKKLDDRIDAQGPDAMLNVDSTVQELNRLEDTIRNMRGSMHNAMIDISKQTTKPIIDAFTSGIETTLGLSPGTLASGGGIDAGRLAEDLATGAVKKKDVEGQDLKTIGPMTQERYKTTSFGPEISGPGAYREPMFKLDASGTAIAGAGQLAGFSDKSPIMTMIAMAGYNALQSFLKGINDAQIEVEGQLEESGGTALNQGVQQGNFLADQAARGDLNLGSPRLTLGPVSGY